MVAIVFVRGQDREELQDQLEEVGVWLSDERFHGVADSEGNISCLLMVDTNEAVTNMAEVTVAMWRELMEDVHANGRY